VLLMGGAALLMLFVTGGNIHVLIVMYSINVFVTFTLSQLAMTRFWIRRRQERRGRNLGIHLIALVMCAVILAVTAFEKFSHGGWLTMLITTAFVVLCFAIRAHYDGVRSGLRQLDEVLGSLTAPHEPSRAPLQPGQPTAVLLVNGFNGLGVHTLMSTLRFFPGLYRQFVFVSVAVVDSGTFKGKQEVDALRAQVQSDLDRYVRLTRGLGFPAEGVTETGTDVVEEATRLCAEVARRYPRATIITGKLVFKRERWFQRFLHNEMPALIQRRLQWLGIPMVVLPIRAAV
jgi:K+ transporter